ncbi:putative Protein FAN [Paratrimastix pyriformis]|uniref:Protein FAN n=1 Tax=Paratrimastix pyriformis TaxID=342808 RepID=A0ABQ8UJC4_9EUKA|nr:putative Protein FAN [Paratrimastix pyriformis]
MALLRVVGRDASLPLFPVSGGTTPCVRTYQDPCPRAPVPHRVPLDGEIVGRVSALGAPLDHLQSRGEARDGGRGGAVRAGSCCAGSCCADGLRNPAAAVGPVPRSANYFAFVCARCLIFEPDDIHMPVLKLHFKFTEGIKAGGEAGDDPALQQHMFLMVLNTSIEMKVNNLIYPYKFEKITENARKMHKFRLDYVPTASFLPRVAALLNIYRLPDRQESANRLQQVISDREHLITFDMSRLEDLSEKTLLEFRGADPLANNPGRFVVSTHRVYFQPFNNVSATAVYKYELAAIERVLRRRYLLRHVRPGPALHLSGLAHKTAVGRREPKMAMVGLEFFFSGNKSSLFAFAQPVHREAVYNLIMQHPDVPASHPPALESVTAAWQQKRMTNLEYLLFLNSSADRTFNDITHARLLLPNRMCGHLTSPYPVFPWVLSDYTSPTLDLSDRSAYRDLSKPIGALSPHRLAYFKERYREMPEMPGEPKFLYGTHYSNPGYVLFYLVRKAPECMLRLQDGRFDQAERLFTDVAETWSGVLVNHADLKEVRPLLAPPAHPAHPRTLVALMGPRHAAPDMVSGGSRAVWSECRHGLVVAAWSQWPSPSGVALG